MPKPSRRKVDEEGNTTKINHNMRKLNIRHGHSSGSANNDDEMLGNLNNKKVKFITLQNQITSSERRVISIKRNINIEVISCSFFY